MIWYSGILVFIYIIYDWKSIISFFFERNLIQWIVIISQKYQFIFKYKFIIIPDIKFYKLKLLKLEIRNNVKNSSYWHRIWNIVSIKYKINQSILSGNLYSESNNKFRMKS